MFKDPFTFESLFEAAYKCKRNVSWKESVTIWMNDVVKNCTELETEIAEGSYKLLEPTVFHIKDPKPRTISAMKYRDRVVQRSMCECGLYEDLTRDLIYDNAACQKDKGTTFAIDRLLKKLRHFYFRDGRRSNQGWIVRLDIRKYFPSIPHELLKREVAKRVDDERTIRMVNHIIDEAVKIRCEDDLSFNLPGFGVRGIGLGSQISQLLALCYLSDLDHYIVERLKSRGYIRYMDDMIILVDTKEEAEEIMRKVKDFAAKKGMSLNKKSKIFRMSQPFEFLKIMFTLTKTGKVTYRAVRASMNREIKRMNKKIRRFKNGKTDFFQLLQHMNTWFGYAKHRASHRQILYIRDLIRQAFAGFEKIEVEVIEPVVEETMPEFEELASYEEDDEAHEDEVLGMLLEDGLTL